jgi:iron complex outermembrane receptor protein
LPAARTWQVDTGIRFALTNRLNLIAGVFSIHKPYFNFDANNVDRFMGTQRSQGFELSISGQVGNNLSVVAGLMEGHVEVNGAGLASLGVGRAALGQPNTTAALYLDYVLPNHPKWSLDTGVQHWGITPASIDNQVDNPPLTVANLGVRYRFRVANRPATLRLQVDNAFDHYIWNVGYTPGYNQYPPRAFLGYVTVDF